MDRRTFVLGVSGVALLSLSVCRGPGNGRSVVRTQFGWIFDAHHAGFIVAYRQGMYERANLDVRLLPGGTETNPVRMVVSNAAEVGQAGGIEQLITAIAEGLPIRPLVAIHRRSPHALISTERAPIREPADLRGKRIAVAYGDTAEVLLKAFMRRNGIRLTEVNLVPFRFDLTSLLAGDVDAVTGFRTDQPATIRSRGQTPVTLAYDDFGVSSYGYTLFATRAGASEHQRSLAAFIQASREGWQHAFAEPALAIGYLRDLVGPAVDEQVEIEKLGLIRSIMLNSDGSLPDWRIEEARIREVISYLVEGGQLRTRDLGALVDQVVSG